MARFEAAAEAPRLTAYRRLLDHARLALQTAREERWNDLAALDADRSTLLEHLVEADLASTKPLDNETHAALIQAILDSDEQTRALIDARQVELAELLGSMDNERKLENAYRSV